MYRGLGQIEARAKDEQIRNNESFVIIFDSSGDQFALNHSVLNLETKNMYFNTLQPPLADLFYICIYIGPIS